MAAYTYPSLTTVAPDTHAIAQVAMQMLQERIAGFDGLGRHRLVDHSLVVRESAPAPAALTVRRLRPAVVRPCAGADLQRWIFRPHCRHELGNGRRQLPACEPASRTALTRGRRCCAPRGPTSAARGRSASTTRTRAWPAAGTPTPPSASTIVVPFPPESPASTIHDTSHHTIAWYHRDLSAADLAEAGRDAPRSRVLLHFGAVDYRCKVWLNGTFLGEHEGGHTPFSFDVTDALEERAAQPPRRPRRGRPARRLEAARQAGLAGRSALHLVPPHHGHLAAGLARGRSRGLDPVGALGARRALVLCAVSRSGSARPRPTPRRSASRSRSRALPWAP